MRRCAALNFVSYPDLGSSSEHVVFFLRMPLFFNKPEGKPSGKLPFWLLGGPLTKDTAPFAGWKFCSLPGSGMEGGAAGQGSGREGVVVVGTTWACLFLSFCPWTSTNKGPEKYGEFIGGASGPLAPKSEGVSSACP